MLYRSEGLCGGKELPFLRIKREQLYEESVFAHKKAEEVTK